MLSPDDVLFCEPQRTDRVHGLSAGAPMSARHINYKQFVRAIYHEGDKIPASRYSPKAAQHKAAVRRGNVSSASNKMANALFDRLTKGAS